MSQITFEELTKQVFEAYNQRSYTQAYDLVTRSVSHFPERAVRLYFWRACLASRMGETDLALDLLEEALSEGHWFYTTGLQEDPDLEALQGSPRFDRILEICDLRQAEARAQASPHRIILEPESAAKDDIIPVLIALHGNNSNAQDTVQYWQSAASKGWLVALPQSSQVTGPDTFGWNDREWTKQDLQVHYHYLAETYNINQEMVILAGFSMGGRWAVWMTLNGSIPATGFIAVAPFIPDIERFIPLIATVKDQAKRGYVIAGEQDHNCYPGAKKLVKALRSHGMPCEFESHPELAHAYPPHFSGSIDRAIAYIDK